MCLLLIHLSKSNPNKSTYTIHENWLKKLDVDSVKPD